METETESLLISDIPLGKCWVCKKKQVEPAKGGIWLDGRERWICYKCKEQTKFTSVALACEFCRYENVEWFKDYTYQCPRCDQGEYKSTINTEEH